CNVSVTALIDTLSLHDALPISAVTPVLVEASQRMVDMQRETLAGEKAEWCGTVASLPTDAPLIVLANEFLDALPVRQFQRGDDRSEEHTSELQSRENLVCRPLL